MSNQRIKIPRLSDRSIVEAFKTLANQYGVPSIHVSALGYANIGTVNLSDEESEVWKSLLDLDSYLIDSMSLAIGGLSIAYARGGQYPSEQKSPIYDEIVLNWNNQESPTNKQKLEIVAYLNKTLRSFEPDRIIHGGVSDESSQLLAIHQDTLKRLELLNEDLIRQSAEFRRDLEQKFDEKVKLSDDDYAKKKELLKADTDALSNQLNVKESALDKKLKAIDDRDNTHVRREIRDRMLDDVKQRISKFGVSATTERKRLPVLLGIAILIATFAGLLIWTAHEISTVDRLSLSISAAVQGSSGSVESAASSDKTNLYLLWIRFTLFSLGLVGTLLYYIKWQNKWAEQHSSSEFQLQQFYIDVNRANWVIESCLEWRKETVSPIPKELLASITNGLFVNNQAEPERVIHPADELASALMGSASKLNLKVGDSELEFDKPKKIPNGALAARS